MEKWIWLAEKFTTGCVKTDELLDRFGSAEGVYEATEQEYRETYFLSRNDIVKLTDKSLSAAYTIMEACRRKGYRILTLDSEEYPEKLRNIPQRPLVLYVEGQLPDVDRTPSFSIVGTRKATAYGAKVASVMAMGIAQAGGIVTSGMAVGIDSFAHKGALRGGGKTIAVLGSGLDVVYPASNAELKKQIAERGCVISEFSPGTKPSKISFPIRNRIIAGLSEATIVVEAGVRSGSLITANLAAEQGRAVYAVPGNIDSSESAGPNRLILDGARPLVTVRQLIGEYVGLYPHALDPARLQNTRLLEEAKRSEEVLLEEVKRHQRRGGKEPAVQMALDLGKASAPEHAASQPEIPPQYQEIYSLLAQSPCRMEDLVEKTGRPVYRIAAELTAMEVKGMIEILPTGCYTVKN